MDWLSDFQEANGNALDALNGLRWIVGNLRLVGFDELAERISDNVYLLAMSVNQMDNAVSQMIHQDYKQAQENFFGAFSGILDAIEDEE